METNITLTLTRNKREGKAVRGTVIIPFEDGERQFDTLENADYLIPEGTYPLRLTWSPKFKKLLPLVDEVPERDGIRIHLGTRPEHSQGCILVNIMALESIKVFFNQQKKWYDNDNCGEIGLLGPLFGLDGIGFDL